MKIKLNATQKKELAVWKKKYLPAKTTIIAPIGMTGVELKQLKIFDKDQYDGLKSKIRFRSL